MFYICYFKITHQSKGLFLLKDHIWLNSDIKSSTYFCVNLGSVIEFAVLFRWSLLFLLIIFFSWVLAWMCTGMLASVGAHCLSRCAHEYMYAYACMWRPSAGVLSLLLLFFTLFIEAGCLSWAQSWQTELLKLTRLHGPYLLGNWLQVGLSTIPSHWGLKFALPIHTTSIPMKLNPWPR